MTASGATLDVSKSILIRSEPDRRCGVSAETIPGTKIQMQVLTVAPGGTAIPGNSLDAEVAAYIEFGRAKILTGKDFTDSTDAAEGEFYFTPAQSAHLISNPYDKPLRLVVAYSLEPSFTNVADGSKAAEAKPAVVVVPTPKDIGTTAQTRGMRRAAAISAETVGATQIWMCSLSIMPNGRGQPHHHGDTHTVAYTLSGKARICFGSNFEEFVDLEAGDFAFDPPGLVHLVDQFEGEPWEGVLARCPQNTVVNFGK
jgi:uncharacterized RmlC-like cupin family protein